MDLKGSYVAIVTPFRDGKLDEKAYRELIEFQIAGGTDGIVPCGTTGESATLDHDEHARVVRLCVEAVAGRVPVLAGTGSNSTAEAVTLTRDAKSAGADGALLITPYYNKPTQEGLYRHYRAVAEATDLPIVVYNCPGRTGGSIDPKTLGRLAEIPNIAGVKDATGNLDWTTETTLEAPRLAILSGDDTMTIAHMVVGARGVISVTANIAPRQVSDLCRHALAGRWEEALAKHRETFRLTRLLFSESNPIPVKAALAMAGRIAEELRLPLSPMGAETRERLRAELLRMGLLERA